MKRGQYLRPGCTCGRRGRAAGAKGCVGHWAAVGWGTWSSCLAPQHQPPRPFLCSLLCLVQLWGERAFIYCALHFSLSAGWQSVFLLPEPRQAVFFCARLQGVTPLFPTLTSKAAVWSFPCVTENNHWSRFLTNFDWLVSLIFITFVSISINTHVTIILLPAGDPELDLLLCYLYSVFVFGISWFIVCSVKFWLYF